jgi:NADH:ubiquinone oxidoreductase subunit H
MDSALFVNQQAEYGILSWNMLAAANPVCHLYLLLLLRNAGAYPLTYQKRKKNLVTGYQTEEYSRESDFAFFYGGSYANLLPSWFISFNHSILVVSRNYHFLLTGLARR